MAKTAKKKEVINSISTSVNYSSENMRGLRNARTATEFRNILDGVIASVSSFKIPKTLASLSARAVDLSDLKGTVAQKQTKAIDLNTVIDLSKIDITKIQDKAKYNQQVSNLNQAITELGIAYQILSSKTFTAFKDQNKAADSLLSVIKDATETQNRMIKLMSIDVKNGTPKEHTKLAATIANYLSKILNREQYSKIRTRTFIAKGTDPITFQTYIFVDDFVNSDNIHHQNYAIVLTTSVAVANGLSTNYVTTLVDEKVPGSFPYGRTVETVPSLKKAVNSLLAIDGFLNYSERRPLNRDTGELRNNTMFGSERHNIRGKDREIFDNVRVQNDSLYVRLVQGLSANEKREAIQEILAMASTVFRAGRSGKNSIIHQIVNGRNGREYVKVSITTSSGTAKGVLTLAKIDQFADVLGLNAQQKRVLKQSVK
ncbi:hypothetical protein YOLOSWAG_179 [Erwinia phage vB_EamM_Yoloswag]|uniref:Uncharacterized protein n=1 Tax=Erwinia phage vB_EamM_Yoloswag TaxID=1958956 RepID=A0A1S6L3A1_9CAUD|nr:hypothetical protein HOR66_gp179 [Erwinia phage vB_EamM_Yoloswag]AQT28658.1 hypothetical protein YOLOSWAG_179 [Erwinia phage vB_EamM_Yoloswag]